jgi:hypothetical protein
VEVYYEAGRWWVRHNVSGKLFRLNYSQRVAAEFLAQTHLQLWARKVVGEDYDLQTNFVRHKSEVREDQL